jgi:hypothetical protein
MNLELCKFENIKESDKNFKTLYVILYIRETVDGLKNVNYDEIYLKPRCVMRIILEPS